MERKVNAELRAKGAGSDSPLGKADVEGVIISETSWHSKKREREKKTQEKQRVLSVLFVFFPGRS